MKFAVNRTNFDPLRDQVADAIVSELQTQGHTLNSTVEGANFVLNLIPTDDPPPFRRHAQSVFVVSIAALRCPAPEIRTVSYRTLVRSLANIAITIQPSGNGRQPEVYFSTPESGFYHYPFNAARVLESMLPIVSSRLVIRNRLTTNLPQRYWQTSPVVEQLKRYGQELDRLGVLPSPFPLREILGPADIDHLYQIFEMTGLSYGNLSARENVPELGNSTFWMTARGVNKARLAGVGKDILLVTGHDEGAGEMLLSVPPVYEPKVRVSVDAIEHNLIYGAFPGVGAIVHVHAWMDGVPCTHQNHPCGTIDLARGVRDLLAQTESPERTVVGLKNHGLTITGPDLPEIFERIRGKLRTEVPMMT